jgi:hypothetical protein
MNTCGIVKYIFVFYLFCPNSLFQTPILFSLHPGGSLRHSRWPYRSRTTLRRASPDRVPTREVIQSNQCEFTHHPGADDHTASTCLLTVRPPAPASLTTSAWSRGPWPYFGYTRTCSCSDDKTFGVNKLFGDSTRENLWLDLNQDTLPHVYFRDQQWECHHGIIRRRAGRSP